MFNAELVRARMNDSKDHKEEPTFDCNVGPRIERYLSQLAPNQDDREWPTLLRDALAALNGLARYANHQQARIDALMFEYCPDEMTPEQIAEWERWNKPAMKECEHEEGSASWDYWRCSKCGWIKPGGEHRWNKTRGFFPSMDAVKQYDKFGTYPGMDTMRPMVPYAD